jgi:hypothetical protein
MPFQSVPLQLAKQTNNPGSPEYQCETWDEILHGEHGNQLMYESDKMLPQGRAP